MEVKQLGFYRYRPSKTAKREFAKKMEDIDAFCSKNQIYSSKNNNSYYFEIKGKKYRVSNHSVESRKEWDIVNGEVMLVPKKDNKRSSDTTYIHASKTRIKEIYNNLQAGKN